MVSKPIVTFRYSGRFAHFLRAEASASAFSYPLPPRTVLLGVLGAVLGLAKDTPQTILKDSLIAVTGAQPSTHWHRAKFRKELPTPLPQKVKVGAKGSNKPEKPTLIKQEWLIEPKFQVFASLPDSYHNNFVKRLKNRSWHFSPCLGLSEMVAELDFIAEGMATPLMQECTVPCHSVVIKDEVTLDGEVLLEQNLKIQVVRMPSDVTPDRVFSHTNYLLEREGKPIPIRTSSAWQVEGKSLEKKQIMFL